VGRKELAKPANTQLGTSKGSSNLDPVRKEKRKLVQKGPLKGVGKRAVNPTPRGTGRKRMGPTKSNATTTPGGASHNLDGVDAAKRFELELRKQEQDRLDRDSATNRHLGWARFYLAPCFLVFLAFMPPHAQLAIALILGILRKDLGAIMHDVS
jgi:hypothetical protein